MCPEYELNMEFKVVKIPNICIWNVCESMKPFDGLNDMIRSVRDADGLIMEVLQYLFVHILTATE